MALNTAAQNSEGGRPAHPSRLQLVYTAHQQLEDELDTLQAYVSAARKHFVKIDTNNYNSMDRDGFSPWVGVQTSAAQCVDKACRCLRLFNPTRKVTQFKGMTTLTTLYGGAAAAAPSDRVVAFLSDLSERFEGELPMEIALSGGRCLQRLVPAAADAYLVKYIQSLLHESPATVVGMTTDNAVATSQQEQQQQQQQRYRACLRHDISSPAYRVNVRALLLLQVEVAAEAVQTSHKLAEAFGVEKLQAVLYTAACEELLKYEAVCWREAARIREAQAASTSSPTASNNDILTSTTTPNTATANTSSASLSNAVTTQIPGCVEGRSSAPTTVAAWHFAGLSQWKWHGVRVALLLLLAVLVRFASGPLARVLKGALRVTHTAQSRRRTLTL